VETTLEFCKFVLKHEAFVTGQFDTGFIGRYFKPEMLQQPDAELELVAAMAGALIFDQTAARTLSGANAPVKQSKWKSQRLS
jgi:propionyl-CoA carboxylase alpha chain